MAGDNFGINISAMSANVTCSMKIVSLNEHMALNLNEYMFLKLIYILEWIQCPWMNMFSLNEDIFPRMNWLVPWKEYDSVKEYNCLDWLYFLWINICPFNEFISLQLTSTSFPWSWINTIPWSCIRYEHRQIWVIWECRVSHSTKNNWRY